MQQVMRIGDTFVPADDDIKDIGQTATYIHDVAQKYKTDVLAVIGKGDKHTMVTQHHEQDTTELIQDVAKIVALIQTVADTYEMDATELADAVKLVTNEIDKDNER